MQTQLQQLSRRYDAELKIYVEYGADGDGLPAIKLGSQIIAIGLEKVELTRIHAHALSLLMNGTTAPKAREGIKKLAGLFFVEAMKPIEIAQRATSVGKANLVLRSAQLALSNKKLKQEVVKLAAAEKTIREKEQNVRDLLKKSLSMQAHLRQLSRDLISAQEEERKNISRELHDDIAQTLMGINVNLATLKMEAAANTHGLKKKIANTQRIVKKSVEIVNQFARRLRPTMLDDLGIIPALISYIKDFTKRSGIKVQFAAFPGVEQVECNKRTVIYRVAQEALTNVAKHAKAQLAKVSIQQNKAVIEIEILDNGQSFKVQDVLSAKTNKRLGLLGMRERVEMVGGTLVIESARSKGTLIRACIPFKKGGIIETC